MANDNESLRLMSLQEVATALHVSPHTVRSWTRNGRLNPTRICRRLLFDPAHVAQFVRASQALYSGCDSSVAGVKSIATSKASLQ